MRRPGSTPHIRHMAAGRHGIEEVEMSRETPSRGNPRSMSGALANWGARAGILGAVAASLLCAVALRAQSAPAGVKNVVLVHGGFVDGSGWEGVYKALRKDGY